MAIFGVVIDSSAGAAATVAEQNAQPRYLAHQEALVYYRNMHEETRSSIACLWIQPNSLSPHLVTRNVDAT